MNLLNLFRHKHSWVLMGLRVVPINPKVKIDPEKLEKGSRIMKWTFDWDYKQCRKCGEIRDKW